MTDAGHGHTIAGADGRAQPCPDCESGVLVPAGGCRTCRACGYSPDCSRGERQ